MLVQKISGEQNYAHTNLNQGQPVNFSGQLVDGSAVCNSLVFVSERKYQSNAAFSSWGVVGGDDLSSFQSGTTEVRIVNLSGVEAARSWGTPGGDLFFGGNDRERVTGGEILGAVPADNYGLQRIMDFDALCCVDDLWGNHENPENQTEGEKVQYASDCFCASSCGCEAEGGQSSDEQDDSEVNPVTSGAVNIAFIHDSQTTPVFMAVFSDLATKKGA